MRLPGGWEYIIILIIVLLLFGPGRLSKIASEIGKSIREFRSGISGEEEEVKSIEEDEVKADEE
jgi:sec-independent protein translocase protein TatA